MRRYFYDWLFYVTIWVVVTLLYSLIYLSILQAMLVYLDVLEDVKKEPVFAYMISNYQYVEALLFGILFGTATFGINLGIDSTSIHRLSYGKIIVIKTVLYVVAMAIISVLMYGIIMTIGMSPVTPDEYTSFLMEHPLPISFYFGAIVFFIMSTLLINFIALMNKKFGQGQMWSIFIGKYNRPITENRIFMFLDLSESTTIAEKLGHIIYSKLLQQCFLDLNRLIPASNAEIYQYVGDEAVLTWKVRNYDLNFVQPIQLFFAFRKRLEKKAKLYKSKFGVVPEFKAGVNAGVVTVAEIGVLKREIAYHGDVVNTASRLRSACSEFNKLLLASEFVAQNINQSYGYNFQEMGEVNLKGKQNKIKVFSIE